ncbi:MAG TPA: sigma-54 dependent transcriptional regulator [bacterium]|nr:sigma-54 dependent transcriptional regulator [bacterium]HPR87647.1 sigma-54 dependent transcriptional regulator [bacterium]
MKILLIEDEKISRVTIRDTLAKQGFQVMACATGREGLNALERESFEVVITDLRLPDITGLEIVKQAKARESSCTVIVITGYATVETAVTALKLGAYDYLTKPFSPDKLLSMLANIQQLHTVISENIQLKKRITRYEARDIIGSAPVMQKLIKTLRTVAATDHTVLIEGESGTGKELVARFLHQNSERSRGPFVAVNCAVLPEGLLESELFGHEKGAFTGAHRRHLGYIERAHDGTLFIDDIDDLPTRLQVKLLRVLQEHEIQHIGGQESIPVNFRVLCATKANLLQMVRENTFREDLYYRINIIALTLPPLRERREDIPLLIDHFIAKHHHGGKAVEVTPDLLQKMLQYDWPGNVRELENSVQRLIALPQEMELLPAAQAGTAAGASAPAKGVPEALPDPAAYDSYDAYIGSREREILAWAMRLTDNNISAAARRLKIPRSTLQSKLEKLGKL